MVPVTFYPGPSKVYPQVREFMQDAYDTGVLSLNHRSSGFMEICRNAITGLKLKLNVPDGYSVMLVSSSTECWEIIAQSLTRKGSYHLYNGAFGEKWLEYARRIHPLSAGAAFGLEENILAEPLIVPEAAEVICLTQNETSNGTQVHDLIIRKIKEKYPDKLIAVDATSSLGGVMLKFTDGDVWFASVQKCLGLPAGLGILICSPAALEKARQINDRRFYNSLLFIHENFQKFQTPYTPNVLDIYLLSRVLEMVMPVREIHSRLVRQATDWYRFFESGNLWEPLVRDPSVRSDTVITIKAEEGLVARLKEKARAESIILGNGYGEWKTTTFRIANFPAITGEEINLLRNFMTSYRG
jgi:phosphoserine aminotransferase